MKKLVTVLILLAVAGGGAYYYYTYGKTVEKPQVVQAVISQGDITETVQATGTLEAQRVVQVGSQVSGTVSALYADFNSIVHKGELLAKIDPTLLQVQVDLQTANVERQKGEIESQQVQLDNAQTQLKRTQAMFDKGLANQQDLDQAVLTVKTRQTALDAARKQLVTNEANLNQAKLNVSYTNIYSPIDGVVVNRVVDEGQAVQSSMNTPQFFTIATDLRTLKLSAGVDEADIGKIRRGMKVNFTVDSYPNTTFSGTVDAVRLNATTQSNVVTYPVWINAQNPDLKLRPSMTANLHIVITTAPNVVRIPNQALRFRPTNDMFTSLGLTPPPAGRGGRGGRGTTPAVDGEGAALNGARGQQARGGQTANGAAAPGRNGQAPTGNGADFAAGQGGRGGQGFSATQGRGQFANMTPEERQRMIEQGGGRGGRRNGGPQAQAQPAAAKPLDQSADKIDDLYAPLLAARQAGQVWIWDAANNKLTATRLFTGISDGQFTQLLNGNVKVGQQVVTNIIVPQAAGAAQRSNQNIFGGGGPRGFGGGGFGGRRGGD